MAISVVGIDFKTASVEIREPLALTRPEVAQLLATIAAEAIFPEALVLSTCNRTEFYFAADAGRHDNVTHLLAHVAQIKAMPAAADVSAFYRYDGAEAVRHLFAVASSLESQIVGEREIQGQVKDAYRLACEARTVKFLLHKVMHWSFLAAKRVMTETQLGQGTASVSQAAVDLSRQVFASLAGKTVLLVGAGQTAEGVCQSLVRAGATTLVIANRTLASAKELVDSFVAWQQQEASRKASGADDEQHRRCPALVQMLATCPMRHDESAQAPALHTKAITLEEIPSALPHVDLLICSSGAAEPVIRAREVKPALSGVDHSLLMIDISVPRNIEPAVGDLPNVFLYNIDALEALVSRNTERRRQEIPRARAIIDQEVERFESWLASLGVVPTIKKLTERIAELQLAQVDQYQKKFSAAQRQSLEEFARALCAKIMHDPIAFLRKLDGKSESHHDLAAVNTLRSIFRLDDEEEK